MSEYFAFRDGNVNELESLHKLKTSSSLHRNVNWVLVDIPYRTHSAKGQAGSASEVLSRKRS